MSGEPTVDMHLNVPTERLTMPPPPGRPFPQPHPLLSTCCLTPKSAAVWEDTKCADDISEDSENNGEKVDVKEISAKTPVSNNKTPAAAPGCPLPSVQGSPRQFANTYTLPELRMSYNMPAVPPTFTTLAWATIYLACRRERGRVHNPSAPAPDTKEEKPITFVFNQAQFMDLLQGSENTWEETLSFAPGSSIPCMANGLVDLLRNSKVYKREELPILMQHTVVVAANVMSSYRRTPAVAHEWQTASQNAQLAELQQRSVKGLVHTFALHLGKQAQAGSDISNLRAANCGTHGHSHLVTKGGDKILEQLKKEGEGCVHDLALTVHGRAIWLMDMRLPSEVTDDDMERLVNMLRWDGKVTMLASDSPNDPETMRMDFTSPPSPFGLSKLTPTMRTVLPQVVQKMILNRCPRLVLHNWNRAVLLFLDSYNHVHVSPYVMREATVDREYSMLDLMLALEWHAKSLEAPGPWSRVVESGAVFDGVLGCPGSQMFSDSVQYPTQPRDAI